VTRTFGRELVGRTLYDITHLLESVDDADERVRRVLVLLRDLVPYDQVAMLEARLGYEAHVVMVPERPLHERGPLTQTLLDIFGRLIDVNGPSTGPTTGRAAPPTGVHLAVPLVGLDEVIGLLFVRSAVEEYTEEHLRALSVVAANLGGYFTMLRGRAELAELARERDQARRDAERLRVADASGRSAPDRAAIGGRTRVRLLADVRVLLVDCDLGLRESVHSVLEHYGAKVTSVASVPEALAVLARTRPDVLLFGDLAMRGDASYDLLRELASRTCPLPIASVSGWRLEEREREAAASFRLHLAKPFEVQALVDTVADLAGRVRSPQG